MVKYTKKLNYVQMRFFNKIGALIGIGKIDHADYVQVSKFNWCLEKDSYAITSKKFQGKNITTRLHRFILASKKGQEVDHINRDKIDNRRSNLRHVTHYENTLNRRQTGDGVSFRASRGKWRARIKYKGKEKTIGCFPTEQAAITARKNYLRKVETLLLSKK